MARRTRKTGAAPQGPRRRLEDRVPGVHGMSVGILRRGTELPAQPVEREPLSGRMAGLSVRFGVEAGVLRVTADLPGMNASDIAVTLGDGSLTLRGVHCRFGAFDHVVWLPQPVRGGTPRVAADRTRLQIELPLAEGVEPAAPE